MTPSLYNLLLVATGCAAGIINALAGGGPILTLGVLSVTGIDPRIANLTSTVALSPGQFVAGFSARGRMGELRLGHPIMLVALGMIGGAGGALVLLATAAPVFTKVVPWLILLAIVIYAGSASTRILARTGGIKKNWVFTSFFLPLTAYGGYFGGGNSFLMLALLAMTGHEPRLSGAIKNVLIAAINFGAVFVFTMSGAVNWPVALYLGVGGIGGSVVGARMLRRFPVMLLRLIVIIGGLALAAWLFAR